MKDLLFSKYFLISGLLILMLASVLKVDAAVRIATATGSWNNVATWGGLSVPGAADDITINAGVVVTMNANESCRTITDMAGGAITGLGTLTIVGNGIDAITDISGTASISCNIVMPASASVTVSGSLDISGIISGAGTDLTKNGAGKLILSASNSYSGATIVAAGVLNVRNSNATGTAAGGITVISGARLELEGAMLFINESISLSGEGDGILEGALYNVSGSNLLIGPITIDGAISRINSAFGDIIIFSTIDLKGNELIIQGGSVGALIAGNISSSVGAGSIKKLDTGTWTLSGNNTFTGGVSLSEGALNIDSPNALGSVAGTFTIGGAGNAVSIDNTSGSAITLRDYPMAWNDDFTFTGSNALNMGAGAITMSADRQITTLAEKLTVGGVLNQNSLSLNKAGPGEFSLKDQAFTLKDLTISDGMFTSASISGSLNLAGNFVNNGTYANNGGSVNFNGSFVQNIGGTQQTNFNNLTLANSAGAILGNSEIITGTLTLTDGRLILGSNNITLGATAVAGSPSVSNMIVADGSGECRRIFTADGSYVFPVGDETGIPEYSPVTLNFTSGTYSSAYAAVRVTDDKHPNDLSAIDFLSRYWTITQSGISSFACDVTGEFQAADVNGTIGNIIAGEWLGSAPWQNFGPVSATTVSVAGVTDFGDFTGISLTPLTLSIAAVPGSSVCKDAVVTLTANPVGAPVFSFLWSPNGETTQSINPSTAAVGSILYSVTVTDANSIITTDTLTVTVNPQPVVTATPSSQSICSGTSPSIALTSNVPGTTFTWTVVQSGVSGAADGTGTTIDQPLLATGIVAGTATYTITPSINGCSGTPLAVVITVNPIPVVTATPLLESICSGAAPSIVLTSNIPSTNFVWTVVESGVSGASPGSGTTIDETLTVTGSASGTSTYTVVPITSACPGSSIAVVITVTPISVVTATPASQTICSATAPAITLTSNIAGATYSWIVVQSGVSGASAGSGNTIDQTLTATGTTAGTATFSVTPTVNGCTGTPVDIVITVNPIPVATATPALQTICLATATAIALTSNIAGTTYAWTVVQSGVSGASAGSGSTIAQTLTATGTSAGTANYSVTPSVNGCTGAPVDIVITVNPIPVATAMPVSQTICSATAPAIALTSNIAATAFTWTVVQSGVSGALAGSGNTIDQTLTATGTTAGTATYTVTPTAGGCNGSTRTVVVTVNPIPVATATPALQTICSATATAIALTSNIAGTTYAWTVVQSGVSGASAGSGSNIAQTLTASGTSAGTATYTVTPTVGGCTGSDKTIVITVNPIPAATATPASQTICSAMASSIALTSNVAGTSFTWTVVQSGVSGASAGSGAAIAQTLTTSGISAGTTTYTVTPTAGGCTGTNKIVVITVNPIPVATATPASQTICSATAPSIALTSNIGGTSFTWTVIQSGVSGATAGSGTTIAQVLTATGTTAGTATYSVSPSSNGCSGIPVDVVITVNPIPVVAATPALQTICSSTATSIALTSNVASTTFTWTIVQSGVFGGSAGSGSGIAQILTAAGTTSGTATYTVTPKANSCSGAAVNVIITVNPIPVVTATPASQTICSASAPSVVLTSNVSGTTFSFTVVQSGVTGAAAGSGATINQVLTTTGSVSGNATYTISPVAGGCAGTTKSVVITVNPIPVATATPASQTICSGSSASIALTSSMPGSTFAWTVSQSGVSGATAGSGSIIAPVLTATGATAGTATYSVTPAANGCAGSPLSVVITVSPIPSVTATPTAQTICSSTAPSVALTSNVPGTIFAWTIVQSGVSGASAASGSLISQVLAATGTTAGTATYTITPVSSGCSGIPVSAIITVNPIAIVTATPTSQTICSATATSISLTSNISGTTFSWTVAQSGVSGALAGSGATITHNLSATGASAGTATYSITPTANGCPGTIKTVIITVNPIPVVTPTPASQAICSGTFPSISLTSNIAGTSFSWSVVQSGVTGAFGGSGTSISQILTTTGSATGTATYAITPVANACSGIPVNVVITVNPNPVITITPASQTICSSTAPSLALTSNISGTSFSWTVVQSGVSGAVAGSGNTINQVLTASLTTDGTATYTITPISNGCTGATNTAIVTVKPIPGASASPASITICSSTAPSIALTSNISGSSYSWTVSQSGVSGASAGSGSTITQTLTATGIVAGTATYSVTPSAAGCSGIPINVVITVNASPVVTATPAMQTICSGTAPSIALTSNVAGTTFFRTVIQSGVSGATSGPGATIAHILTTTGSTSGTATYTVFPAANGCSGASKGVVITVNPKPVAQSFPSSQSICSGSSTSLVLNSNVSGTTFAWTVVVTPAGSITGTNNGSGSAIAQTLINTTLFPASVTYVVTPAYSGCLGSAINVVVTVNPKPVLSSPLSASTCSNTLFSYTPSSITPATTYTWTRAAVLGIQNVTTSGVGDINETLINTTSSARVVTYTYTLHSNGCSRTQDVLVTVYPYPALTSLLSPPAVCSATSFNYTAVSSVSGTLYTWARAVVAGISNPAGSGSGNISEILTNTTTNNIIVPYVYTLAADGCITTVTVNATIRPTPVLSSTLTPADICSNTIFSYDPTSLSPGTSFSWSRFPVAGISNGPGFGTNNPNETLVNTTANAVNVTYSYLLISNGCIFSQNVVVKVNPKPSLAGITNKEFCSGINTPVISFSGPVAGTNYSWTNSNSSIGLAASGSGNIPSFISTNATGVPVSASVVVTPAANGCDGNPVSFTISVLPSPAVNSPAAQTICNGTPSGGIIFTGTYTSISWTNNHPEIGLAATGTGNITSFAGNNPGNNPIIATITAIPHFSAGGIDCAGNPVVFTITVNPTPKVSSVSDEYLCADANHPGFVLSTSATGGAPVFNWMSSVNVGFGLSGSGNISPFTATNGGGVPVTAIVSANVTLNGCTGGVTTFEITVNPAATVIKPVDQVVCHNALTSVVIFSGNATSFAWTNNNISIGLAASGTGDIGSFTAMNAGVSPAVATISVTPIYTMGGKSCPGVPKSFTITVDPFPTSTISGSTTVCQNASAPVLTFTGANGTAPYTFTYQINGGANQTVTTISGNSVTVNVPTATSGVYSYKIINVSSSAGCSQVQTTTASVTVEALPSAIISGSVTVCQNSATPLITFTGASGISPYTFTYKINGGANQVITTSSGNSVTLNAPTAVSGSFVYSLVSVSSTTGCSQVQAGTATITVNPTPNLVITNPAPVCSPATADITASSVTSGSVPGLTFTYWTNAAATVLFNTPATAGNGTYYIKGTDPVTGCFAIKPVTVTVNTSPTLVITNPTPICAPGTQNLTLSAVTAGSTPGLIYTYWIDDVASIVYPTPAAADDDIYFIKGTTAAGCSVIKPVTASVFSTLTIPVFDLGPASSICKGSAPITYIATVTNAFTLTFSLDAASLAGGNTINSSTGKVTWAASWTGTSQITATATGCGAPASAIHTVSVNPTPNVVLSASTATVCEGNSITLTATSSGGTIMETYSGSSGNINQPIADNSRTAYVYSTITLSGSGGATLDPADIVIVTTNILHNTDKDLDFFLVDPTGTKAMLLSSDNGANGNNYTNTIFRTDASTLITAGSAPFTSTYRPEGTITTAPDRTGAAGGDYNLVVPGAALNGAIIDGAWSLRVFDDNSGTSGTLVNWSLAISKLIGGGYTTVVNGPQTIGTVTYSGTNNSIATAVVTPPAGTQVYTVTTTDAKGCSATSNAVSLVIKPASVPTVTADYCTFRPKVRLTTPTCVSCTYSWNTGATTNFLDVDIAGKYTVNVVYANGCTGTASIQVADELVVNGDFSAGNTGFTTDYGYRADVAGNTELGPEGLYGVGTNGQNYHGNFWGRDHTTGTGNFMVVNGWGSTFTVWQQTNVTVVPNTDYYFAAWAMSLNTAGPFAKLRFEVNGVQVGTTANLVSGVNNNTNSWRPQDRFYGMWNSGADTTATIRIINLEPSLGGNDFGLDDISFGTLVNTPFSVAASNNSPVGSPICSRGTLQLTSTITGGRPPIKYNWTGPNGYTSTVANPAIANVPPNAGGTYTLAVTDWYNCPAEVATTGVALNPTPEIPDQTALICSASTFTVTPVNGVPNASTFIPAGTNYTWPAPVISPAGSVTGSSANAVQTTISQTLTNTTSAPATVTYTVTPVAGSCTGNTFKVIVTVNAGATANGGGNKQMCAGSSVLLNGSVGGAATSGNWTGGTGTFAPNRNTLNATYTPSVAEITSGSVTLTLNSNDPDGAGPCSAATSPVIITINPLPVLTYTRVNVLCKGASTGSIDLTVTNGTPVYTYVWTASNGGLIPPVQANGQDLTGIRAGTYTVVVSDSKTCGATTSVIITEPSLLMANESHATVPCSIGATNVTITATGGTAPYTGTGIFSQLAGTTVYTVTDVNFCTASVSATVIADPNSAPVIATCPVTRTINGCSTANISGPAFSTVTANSSYLEFSNATNKGVASDNCAITTVTYQDVASTTCPVVVTRNWSVGDASGLTTTCQQVINVVDVDAPVWTTAAGSLNRSVQCNDAAGLASAIALFPTAADACDPDVTNIVKTSQLFAALLLCPQAGSYTNTWRVTDECGNTSAVYTQVITITDNTAPVWIDAAASLNRTVECSDVAGLLLARNLKPAASDQCDADVSNIVKVSGAFVPGGACGNQGSYTNTWTVADDCGNASAVFTQTISVVDNTAPIWLTMPGALDRTTPCSDAAGIAAAQSLKPVAWDNCSVNVTNIIKTTGAFIASAGCVLEGTFTNTWIVTDDCGNTSAVYTQVITINDNTDPVILCPPSDAYSCDSPSFDPSVTGIANASSSCASVPSLTYSDVIVPGVCAGNYQIIRTWTATNVCGHANSCAQTIFVQDVTPPAITCAVSGNLNIYTNSALSYLHTDNLWDATATDNCSGVTLTATLSGATVSGPHNTLNGVSFNEGVTNVTWIATDVCGTSSECKFTITVAFNPEISCAANITANNDLNVCSANLAPLMPTRISGTLPIIYTWIMTGSTSGSGTGAIGNYNFNAGVTTITWTATNVAGTDVCSQTITVVDNQAPVFNVPTNKIYCVRNIVSAEFFDPAMDISPDRPEYYIFANGNTELDLDPSTFSDNCPGACVFEIRWRIDFQDGTSIPALPATYNSGQPSLFGSDINFLGSLTSGVVHHITYQIVDCSGNVSAPKTMIITVNPRPDVIKLN